MTFTYNVRVHHTLALALYERYTLSNDEQDLKHQQKTTLLAGVLLSTYRTCHIPQATRK